MQEKNIFLYNFVNQNNVIKRAFEKEIYIIRLYIAIEKKKCRLVFVVPQLQKNPFLISPGRKNACGFGQARTGDLLRLQDYPVKQT